MDMETELSPDFYEDSTGPFLQVATVANSKFFVAENFEPSANFMLLSSSNGELWALLKRCKPEDVIIWCDFDTLA
jgi:hypothetical protein